MSRKFLGLAGPAAFAIAAVTACGTVSNPAAHSVGTVAPSASGGSAASGSAPASPAASAPVPAKVPKGYRRVGGSAQGIAVAVPSSWVAINLAKESIQNAANTIGLSGISASTLVRDMQSLQKLRAVFVFDVKSATASSQHFATNLNAYCSKSGVLDYGSAAVALMRQAAATEFRQLNAVNIKQHDIKVGGVPGLETTYELTSTGAGTLQAAQLEVLPKPDRACFVTLTSSKGAYPSQVLPVAAATATFP